MPNFAVDEASRILDWYDGRVREFVENEAADRLAQFDDDRERLRGHCDEFRSDLPVCFLGVSAAGKSTLINALVAGHERVVPTGGIGPLTAQAISVKGGPTRALRVLYHDRKQLRDLLSVLTFANAKARPTAGVHDLDPDDAQAVREIERSIAEEDADASSVIEEFIKRARLMITGTQTPPIEDDLPYLIQAIRVVMNFPVDLRFEPRREDLPRIQRIREAIQTGEFRCDAFSAPERFLQEREAHAAGFLSPLISKLHVAWTSDTLPDDVMLVDLPGVGIANDSYRKVTFHWIRERARVIVLVVGKSGVTEADAELLITSGFLNRLLYSFDNPLDDPVELMVAVTRIDDVAKTSWVADPDPDASYPAHFADACEKVKTMVQGGIKSTLEAAWDARPIADDEDGQTLPPLRGKEEVIRRIVDRLKVFPISAPHYQYLVNPKPKPQMPVLETVDQTGIPALLNSLEAMAETNRMAMEFKLKSESHLFASKVLKFLELTESKWSQEDRDADGLAHLRESFRNFSEPLSHEFHRRQGELHNFFKETMPATIRESVGRAKERGRSSIQRYLKELKSASVRTLKAAIVRGGKYSGARDIEVCRDFSLGFDAAVAEVWSAEILKQIRNATQSYAKVLVEIIDQVIIWANQQGDQFQAQLIKSLRNSIQADIKSLAAVGEAKAAELPQKVSTRLVKEFEKPIRKGCDEFIKSGLAQGNGLRDRIIAFLGELSISFLKTAEAMSVEILMECLREAEQDIHKILANYQNPIESARKALFSTQDEAKAAADDARRQAILGTIATIVDACPAFEMEVTA